MFTVYRITGESASSPLAIAKKKRFALSMAEMRVYYSLKYGYPVSTKLKSRYNKALLTYKHFDTDYKGLYPLIEPTFLNKLLFNTLEYALFRQILVLPFKILMFLKRTKGFYIRLNVLFNKLYNWKCNPINIKI